MKYFYIIFLIFGIIITSFSQNKQTDSLENLLLSVSGKEKVKILNELSTAWLSDSSEISMNYCKQAILTTSDINDIEGSISAFNCFGNIYYEKMEYDSAIFWYKKALKTANNTKNRKDIAECNEKLGKVYFFKNDYTNASTFFITALKIYEEINYMEGVAEMLNGIGLVNLKLDQYQTALEYFLKSLKIGEITGNYVRIAKELNNIGIVYYDKKDYEKTLEYYKKSLKIKEEFATKKALASTFNNIATLYFKIDQLDSSLIYYKKALIICEEENIKWGVAKTSINIAKVYIKYQNYSEAKENLLKGEQIAAELEEKDLLINVYENLYILYSARNNYKKACYYSELSKNYRDTFYNENLSNKIFELQTKYKTEKKEKQILLLSKEKDLEKAKARKQKLLKFLFMTGLLLILIVALLLYRFVILKNKLNNRLNYEKKFLQTLMDANPNPQFYKDSEGKYIGCNKSFEQITGLTKKEVLGKTVQDIRTIHSSYDHEKVDKELFQSENMKKYRATIRLLDNEIHEFEIIKTVYTNSDNIIGGILGIMVDITHIKKQEELVRKQEILIYEQEKKNLQKEIDYKEKELTETSFQLLQNNQYIKRFIKDIKSLSKYSDKEGVEFSKTLISDYKTGLKEKNWENFENSFKSNHPLFINKIENDFPDLTKNDIQICIMIYMDFSSKDIAETTFKSIRTIESTRFRIRKKLNISGTDKDLCQFLKSL